MKEETALNRQQIYEGIASNLFAMFNLIRLTKIDTGMSGGAAESLLVKTWMKQWIPKRIKPISGAAISTNSGPTNQLDCLLFDASENPKFGTVDGISILPIEGICGDIEINYGESTSYDKIEKDCEKLRNLLEMAKSKLPTEPRLYSLIKFNPDIDTNQISVKDKEANAYFQFSMVGKPLALIFAEDINGSLEEVSKRIANFNLKAGVRCSIDGIFVLRKGFALHIAQSGIGWTVQRMANQHFGCLETTEGQVLLKFQSVILNYLHFMGKTSSMGFDRYASTNDQGKKELESAKIVTTKDYLDQINEGMLKQK